MLHTTYTSFTQYAYRLSSVRDAVFYPACIMIVTAITDMATGVLSWPIVADYIASIAVFPVTVMLCDYIPPYIAHNYTILTNPGMKRIVKMCIFMFVATMCMLCVHIVLPDIFRDERVPYIIDQIERTATVVGHAAGSIKFLP